jgi:long-chain fatty acid transport protein
MTPLTRGLAGSAALLVASTASASPLFDTAGAVGGNAGAQGVVSGPGAASTYFNPALLVDAEDGLLVSFGVVSEQIGVTLGGRPAGSDVPLAVGGRDIVTGDGAALPNDRMPTAWLESGCPGGTEPGTCPSPGLAARPRQANGSSGQTRSYVTLGIVKSVARDRASIGLYTMLPVSSFVTARSFYADEREALFSNSLHPELYGDRLTALSFAGGGAFRIVPGLSVGLSATLALANAATASTYVRDASNYDLLLLDTSTRTQVDIAPVLGLSWIPSGGLRFGATLHTPQAFELETTVRATLPAGTESGTTRRDVYHWMPWRVALGAEIDALRRGRYRMAVTGSLKHAAWSSYEDRHGDSPSVHGRDLAFRDTLSGTVGVRHFYGGVRGFMDLSFSPSPVPEQVARSNYVDNDRVGLALGVDAKIPVAGSFVRPGLQLGATRLVPRQNTKDASRLVDELPDDAVFESTRDPVPGAQGLQTNNPGYPGFRSAGYLWTGFFTLEIPL